MSNGAAAGWYFIDHATSFEQCYTLRSEALTTGDRAKLHDLVREGRGVELEHQATQLARRLRWLHHLTVVSPWHLTTDEGGEVTRRTVFVFEAPPPDAQLVTLAGPQVGPVIEAPGLPRRIGWANRAVASLDGRRGMGVVSSPREAPPAIFFVFLFP